MTPAAPAAAAPAPALQAAAATGQRDCDRRFAHAAAATGDHGLAAAAQALLCLHDQGGAAPIAAAFRDQVRSAQRELLRMLERARRGDAVALSEADHRAVCLEEFTSAYAAWRRDSP